MHYVKICSTYNAASRQFWYRCEICGRITNGPNHWFVIQCSDSELTVLKWNSEAANAAGARHFCREAHAQALLPLATIGKLIELLPEPTKSVVVLIAFGSLRIGEVLALRWHQIQADRITVEGRVYEGEFDDVKTDAGERQVPFDKRGLMKGALIGRWNASKHRQPNDLVFCTRKGEGKGGPLGRRNLLRHIKAAATKLGLSGAVLFGASAPCTPASCCARVQGRRSSATTWATPTLM
jgi:integrase